jgi:hypothetical protein
MKGKWWGGVSVACMAGMLLSAASCGRNQQLVSIEVQPAQETFGVANETVIPVGAQVQLRALGTFIHPPVTKDITSQVIWTSNTPQMVTVDANGVVTTTGNACGDTLISATVNTNKSTGGIDSNGAIVTGSMTVNVVCPKTP